MSGPFKRRASLKKPASLGLVKSAAARRRSSVTALAPIPQVQQEVPWDLLERCLLPVIFCQAAAVIVSTTLSALRIWNVTAFTLFIWFTIVMLGVVLFYHNLKVPIVGKAVLITGCDSRIGCALARVLDEMGFTVFAGFHNAVDNPVADELKEESSGRLHVLQLDVSSETQILASSLYVTAHLSDAADGLWAIIHAESWVALGEIEWVPTEVIRKATEINFVGATRLIQVLLPMVRKAKGRVVLVTSGLSRVVSPVRGIHCALQAALEAEATCLRQEMKPRGVDVIVVAPGEYSSGSSWLSDESMRDQAREMWEQLMEEQRKEYGDEYFEAAIRSLEKFTKTQDADLSGALRALSDSVIRAFPLQRYTPISRQEKIQAIIACYFPRSFYDIIYS